MSVFLQPLQLMVYRRQSVIARASLQFLPVESRHAGARAAAIQILPSGDGDKTTRAYYRCLHLKAIEPMFIETKYGIRLEVAGENQDIIHISETSPQEETSTGSDKAKATGYRYRLFPDWQTSYLWYDLSHDANPEDVDDSHVDLDVIEERYPILSPYYQAWRQVYETEFEKQECHLGSGAEPFPNINDRISWEIEGYFIACWLALRSDVHSVEYSPNSQKYILDQDGFEERLSEFLRDLSKEIEAREIGAQESGAKENGAKENGAKENGAKDIGAQEIGAKEVGAKEVVAKD